MIALPTTVGAAFGVVALALAGAASGGAAQSVGARETGTVTGGLVDPEGIDAALRSLVDRGALVGVSALVFEKGHEAYYGAFGMADREAGRPMDRDTLVQLFSMTKPITGVALMQLEEAGKLELDAPLSRYLPEFARMRVYAGLDAQGSPIYEAPRRPITVRDIT